MEASLNGPLGRTELGQGTVKIGRAPNNTLVINDPQSSAHHVEIAPGPDGNSYQVTDLNSTNGTYINEQRLTPNSPRPLNPGDVMRIGSLTFAYETSGNSGYAPTVFANANSFNDDQTVPSQAPIAQQPPAYQQPPVYPQPPAFNNYNAPPQPANTPPPPYQQPPAYPQQAGGFGQPSYPQAGVTQPGYPPVGDVRQPGYPQQKKSRVGLWVGLIILLLLIIGGIGGFVYFQNRSTPAKTLQAYCTALQNNNAQGIYNTLSSASQEKTDINQLSKGLQLVNLLTGGLTCSYSNVQESGSTATATVTLTPARGKAESETAHLVYENGQWKLDETSSIPAA